MTTQLRTGRVCVTTCACLTSHRATSSPSMRSRLAWPYSTTARHPRGTKRTISAGDRVQCNTDARGYACCNRVRLHVQHHQPPARRCPRFDGGPQSHREGARVPCKAGSQDYVPRHVELVDEEPARVRLGQIRTFILNLCFDSFLFDFSPGRCDPGDVLLFFACVCCAQCCVLSYTP